MSRRTFIDNVVNLVIEKCLVRHLPLILTPNLVGRFSDDKIQELAAESQDTQAYRAQLTQEAESLRHGLEKCRKWTPRAKASKAKLTTVDEAQPSKRAATPSLTEGLKPLSFGSPNSKPIHFTGGVFGYSSAASFNPQPTASSFGSFGGSSVESSTLQFRAFKDLDKGFGFQFNGSP